MHDALRLLRKEHEVQANVVRKMDERVVLFEDEREREMREREEREREGREREKREMDKESKDISPQQQLRGSSKAKHEPKLVSLHGAGGDGAGEKQLLQRQQLPQSPHLQEEQSSEDCYAFDEKEMPPQQPQQQGARGAWGEGAAGQQQQQAQQLRRQERQQQSGDCCTWPDDEAQPRRQHGQQQRLQPHENCGVLSDDEVQCPQQKQHRRLKHGAEGPLRAGSKGENESVSAPAGVGGGEVENARAGLNTCWQKSSLSGLLKHAYVRRWLWSMGGTWPPRKRERERAMRILVEGSAPLVRGRSMHAKGGDAQSESG